MKQKLIIMFLILTTLTARGQNDSASVPKPIMPYTYGWDWHAGLNMSLSLSVSAPIGHSRLHGAGFSQRLNATYVKPLTDKLWVAGGLTVGNTLWSGSSYAAGALYAMMGYQFNEHWEAYAWVQKEVAGSRQHYLWGPYYGLWDMPYSTAPFGYGDRIGGAVKYNVNPSVSFQISVEGVRASQPRREYTDHHYYPINDY